MQGGYEVALNLRKLDVCAVTTLESGSIDLHFLTLKAGRYTTGKHHCAGVTHLFEQLLRGGRVLTGHIKLHQTEVLVLEIFYYDLITFALLNVQRSIDMLYTSPSFPHISQRITIHYEPGAVVKGQ